MFDFLVIAPFTNIILGFYELVGENLGLAIILFTIVIRILLLPLTARQIKLQRKMAELQPRLQELQAKRGKNGQMSAEETALMRQTAGSCLGGCLPLLLQIPVFIGLSIIIRDLTTTNPDTITKIFDHVYFDSLRNAVEFPLNTNFLGFNLASKPSEVGLGINFIPYALMIALLVVTQFIQSKMTSYLQKKKPTVVKQKANSSKLSAKEIEQQKMQEDMQKMMQMQMTYFIPIAIGLASYSFSAALGLYWLTQNLFAIAQTYVQNRMMNEKKSFRGLFIKSNSTESNEKIREAEVEDVTNEADNTEPSSKSENAKVDEPQKKSKKNKNKVKSKKKNKKK